MDLVIRARRVVTPTGETAAAVRVRDGVIAAIEPYDAVGAHDAVDLADDEVLLPGLVDTHVHVNEPGRTEWEGFATATRAAAAGGVTTILDMPLNSLPPTCTVDALQIKRKAADGRCHVDVGFWGGAIPGNVDDLRGLHDEGVFGFKCFLAPSGVDEFPPLSVVELERYLAELAGFGAMMIVHAEDGDALAQAPEAHGRRVRRLPRLPPARRREPRDRGAHRGGPAHGCGGAPAASVQFGRGADGALGPSRRDRHHRRDVPALPRLRGGQSIAAGATQFKCCPPIREADNREDLWAALGRGDVDCVVSDHSPCVPELKGLEHGDFGTAWGGISSLQIGLPAVWTEARRRGHTIGDVVRWMAQRPAEIAGLTRKGRIAPGCDADLVAFAPDAAFVVNPGRLYHRNPVTPYADRALAGVVRRTWLRGAPITDREPRGRLIRRGEA